jgi:hypothetical protein
LLAGVEIAIIGPRAPAGYKRDYKSLKIAQNRHKSEMRLWQRILFKIKVLINISQPFDILPEKTHNP